MRSDMQVQILCDNKLYGFEQDNLSLSAFEKAAGMRTGIRTCKPKEFDTYLDLLRFYAKQRNYAQAGDDIRLSENRSPDPVSRHFPFTGMVAVPVFPFL